MSNDLATTNENAKAVDDVATPPATRLIGGAVPPELAESVRGLINRHELRDGSQLPTRIAVTGPIHGVGVTTMSQAIATVIAQDLGRSVCWLDGSWMRQGTESAPANAPTLTELLDEDVAVDEAFERSDLVPQLVCLAPGPVPDGSQHRVARSPEVERLIAALSERFDHVVFDLPPVISHASALALLRLADGVVVVVRHHATSTSQLRRTLDVIDPTPNLGVVLNGYRTRIPAGLRRLLGE